MEAAADAAAGAMMSALRTGGLKRKAEDASGADDATKKVRFLLDCCLLSVPAGSSSIVFCVTIPRLCLNIAGDGYLWSATDYSTAAAC